MHLACLQTLHPVDGAENRGWPRWFSGFGYPLEKTSPENRRRCLANKRIGWGVGRRDNRSIAKRRIYAGRRHPPCGHGGSTQYLVFSTRCSPRSPGSVNMGYRAKIGNVNPSRNTPEIPESGRSGIDIA